MVEDVIRFDSKLVAVGTILLPPSPDPYRKRPTKAAVWISLDDGKSWTPVPHDAAAFEPYGEMRSVTVGGPGVVAVGKRTGGNGVWTSADGINWDLGSIEGGYTMSDVITTSSGLYAVGYKDFGGSVWKSSDGQNWSHVFTQSTEHPGSDPPFRFRQSSMRAVAVRPPGYTPEYIAFESYQWRGVSQAQYDLHNDAAIWTSTDGTNWTMVEPYDPVFSIEHDPVFKNVGNQNLRGVMVQGSAIYVAGYDKNTTSSPASALLWKSLDGGTTWVRHKSEYIVREQAFDTQHWINAILKINAFGYEEIAVGTMWDDDEDDPGDCAIWLGAQGSPRWRRFTDDLLGGKGRQSCHGALGYSSGKPGYTSDKDVIVIVGRDKGSPAIWTLALPDN